MSTLLETIQEKAQQLSPPQQAAVIKFMETLLHEKKSPTTGGMKLDWSGGMKDPPVPYSSVELQHLANVWRLKDEMKLGLIDTELTFDWVDGPDAPPEPLTSVELQHMATHWWVEEELERQ